MSNDDVLGRVSPCPSAFTWTNLFNAGGCVFNPNSQCVLDITSSLSYRIPKTLFETTVSSTVWSLKKINSMIPGLTNNLESLERLKETTNNPSVFTKLYAAGVEKTADLSLRLTSIVTNIPTEQLTASRACFTAIDLIGPTLLLQQSTQRALTDLLNAGFYAKLLATGQREVSTLYIIPIKNCKMEGNCNITVTNTRCYTTAKLVQNVAMETVFAGIWSLLAYASYNGIYIAVEEASKSSEQAALATKTLFIAGIVIPKVFGLLKTLTKQPEATPKSLSHPQLVGIHPDTSKHLDDNPPSKKKPLSGIEAARELMAIKSNQPSELEDQPRELEDQSEDLSIDWKINIKDLTKKD